MIFGTTAIGLVNFLLITFGIGVCSMCFVQIAISAGLRRTFRRYFGIFFILLLINMSAHLCRLIMEGQPGDAVSIVLYCLPFVEGLAAGFMTYTFSLLLLSYTNQGKSGKQIGFVMHALIAVNTVFLIVGFATKTLYYFDADNMYHRGSLYLLTNVVPLLLLVIDAVLLIRHGKKIDRRVKIAFWLYIAAPIAAIIVQSISYGIQYIIFATVAASVFVYFAISREQAEQYKKQNESISRLQNGLILVMADLVESRDQCTGDHVRKTAEYTRIIMDQMRRDGVYPDVLTDAFVEDVVRSAPLHDIGKIHVSDVILNKPGKLTDEEFAEIKEHTTAGRDIIGSAINMVSEESSGYLNEAKNLAFCHHEKWNGTGYPQGLSGEDIPLSARIMAVADVFDALVSKRSYKDGMPFEKAVEIIREGIGTHFDPKVAEAFLRAEDEVKRVAASDKPN